jgi:thioredoxin 1
MADLQEVTDKDWETEVLNSETPVLVDFWATWCQPCVRLAPIVAAVAEELTGKVKVVKCNTDDARPVAVKYGVMSIPALLLFKGGKVVAQIPAGGQRKEQIVTRVQEHL